MEISWCRPARSTSVEREPVRQTWLLHGKELRATRKSHRSRRTRCLEQSEPGNQVPEIRRPDTRTEREARVRTGKAHIKTSPVRWYTHLLHRDETICRPTLPRTLLPPQAGAARLIPASCPLRARCVPCAPLPRRCACERHQPYFPPGRSPVQQTARATRVARARAGYRPAHGR